MAPVTMYQALPSEDPRAAEASKAELRSIAEREAFVALSLLAGADAEDAEEVNLHEVSYLSDTEGAEDSCFRFVESGWFKAMTAVVIITNLVTILMELDKPRRKPQFFWLDHSLLGFYIFELFSRIAYFKRGFLCGYLQSVCWNCLDLAVVFAGVFDNFVMPRLHGGLQDDPTMQALLQNMRALRFFRALKIIRIFLESDLSWTENPPFQTFVGLVIAFNSGLMGMETDIDWSGWFYVEQVLLAIYVFELTVRLKRFGCFFLSPENPDLGWNLLDFIIVASSTLDTWIGPLCSLLARVMTGENEHHQQKAKGVSLGQAMMLMRMLRLMRILRLVKLVKSVQPLYILVTGVSAAIQSVGWVLVLVITVIYALAIIATRLIGHAMIFASRPDPSVLAPFRNVPTSMFTLFRVMSGASSEQEQIALEEVMEGSTLGKFCFAFFMVSSSWTLLSILTAVVSENMITTTGDQEQELKIMQAEEDRMTQTARLQELFQVIDQYDHSAAGGQGGASSPQTGNGVIQEKELEEFLSVAEHRVSMAKICRVPIRDVRDVMKTCHICNGEDRDVTMDMFVDRLLDVGHPTTERSTMKIEALLTTGLAKLHQQLKVEADARTKHYDEIQESVQKHMGEALQRIEALERCNNVCLRGIESSIGGIVVSCDLLTVRVNTNQSSLEAQHRSVLSGLGDLDSALDGFSKRSDELGALPTRLEALPAMVERLEQSLDAKLEGLSARWHSASTAPQASTCTPDSTTSCGTARATDAAAQQAPPATLAREFTLSMIKGDAELDGGPDESVSAPALPEPSPGPRGGLGVDAAGLPGSPTRTRGADAAGGARDGYLKAS